MEPAWGEVLPIFGFNRTFLVLKVQRGLQKEAQAARF